MVTVARRSGQENGVSTLAAGDSAAPAAALAALCEHSRVNVFGTSAEPSLQFSHEADEGFALSEDTDSLQQNCPGGARCVVVPGAGHALHIERPEAAASMLINWLADC